MEEVNEQILIKAYELGQKYEKKYTGCAQTTIAAIFEALGIWNDAIFKSASGLADGLGLTGNGSCGALIGASLVIGFLFGRERKHFRSIRKPIKSYTLVKKLHDQYVEQYGSCRCHDVQKINFGKALNLWNPDELQEAFESGLIEHCSKLVGNLARLGTKLILENGFNPKEIKSNI